MKKGIYSRRLWLGRQLWQTMAKLDIWGSKMWSLRLLMTTKFKIPIWPLGSTTIKNTIGQLTVLSSPCLLWIQRTRVKTRSRLLSQSFVWWQEFLKALINSKEKRSVKQPSNQQPKRKMKSINSWKLLKKPMTSHLLAILDSTLIIKCKKSKENWYLPLELPLEAIVQLTKVANQDFSSFVTQYITELTPSSAVSSLLKMLTSGNQ